MKSIGKLNLNSNPLLAENGDIKYALNVVATRDQKAVRNEDGFTALTTYTGNIVGRVELPIGYVLFINETTTDKIVYVNGSTTKTIQSNYFNFGKPIKGRYTYNSDGDLYITFTEGVDDDCNETRVINITKTCLGASVTLTEAQVKLLDVIPNVIYPTVTSEVIDGGSLLVGTYQITISYMVEESVYTNPSILHTPIYVFGYIKDHNKIGTSISRAIRLTSSNLDTRYTKYKIGILYRGEDGFEKAYETDDILISTSVYTISNLDSLAGITIQDLTIGSISYIKDQDHVSFNGRLIRGNVKTVKYTGTAGRSIDVVMNTLAANIKVELSNFTPDDSFDIANKNIITKHFKAGEQYLLYVGAFDYKGNFVNAYPIPWKTGDTTEVGYTDVAHSKTLHKIPYLEDSNSTYKIVSGLVASLPNNVDTILAEFASTITSFCYFYAEHNINNSKVLGQGFTIRDYAYNDFNNEQRYAGPFKSITRARLYSFEHLFNKSLISNVSIYNSKKLNGFVTADLVSGETNQYVKIYNDSDSIMTDRNIIDISGVQYVDNDNTISNNIAGDSYHRLEMTNAEINELFGGASNEVAFTPMTFDNLVNNSGVDDGIGVPSRNLTAIADVISNNNYFYDDIYKQKLVICSNIISKTNTGYITLYGDFFYDNLTIRLTGPKGDYEYGGTNLDLQGEEYVIKIIISINIESRFNLRARYSGINDYQKVFNFNDKITDTIKPLLNIPYKYDNFISTSEGKGYSLACHNNGYDYITYDKDIDLKHHFFNRVIRSIVSGTESKGIAWRTFNTNDYKDFPIERGKINIVEADAMAIYVQQEYALLVASLRDTISNDPNNTTFLGSSDLFNREPIEVLFDKAGYIGCDNRFSAIMTPHGYAVVDSVKGNIFLVRGTQSKQLNDENTERWFADNLEAGLVNPYNGSGICLLFDDILNSLFVSQNGIKNFTIHYNFKHGGWLSFHSYIPDMYISDRINSFCISNNTVYRRNGTTKGLYFDNNIVPSEIVYIYNIQPDIYKQILAITWDTIIRKDSKVLYDITFDKLMIYNDTQCTGVIDVDKNIDWFDTETGVYKKDVWYFNQLVDLVKNDKLTFVDDNGNVVSSNLRTIYDWFDANNFLCKFIYIKFGYDNKFTDINTKQKYSVPTTGTSQLEITLNSYDVNAIKSIR